MDREPITLALVDPPVVYGPLDETYAHLSTLALGCALLTLRMMSFGRPGPQVASEIEAMQSEFHRRSVRN